LTFFLSDLTMTECRLRVTHENKNPRIEITYNPGNFNLPQFTENNGTYSIKFDQQILSALAQSNDVTDILTAQLEYKGDSINVAFVTMNMEPRKSDFTASVILQSPPVVQVTTPTPVVTPKQEIVIERDLSSSVSTKTEAPPKPTLAELLGKGNGNSALSIGKSRP
jgi:hypothetical protein